MSLPALTICFLPSTSISSGVWNEKVFAAFDFAIRLPAHVAGLEFEGDEHLFVAAVDAENEQVVDDDRRAAVAVDGLVTADSSAATAPCR